jgi:hypothetical protein
VQTGRDVIGGDHENLTVLTDTSRDIFPIVPALWPDIRFKNVGEVVDNTEDSEILVMIDRFTHSSTFLERLRGVLKLAVKPSTRIISLSRI